MNTHRGIIIVFLMWLSGCSGLPTKSLDALDASFRSKPILVVSLLGPQHHVLDVGWFPRQYREFDARSWRIDSAVESLVTTQLTPAWSSHVIKAKTSDLGAKLTELRIRSDRKSAWTPLEDPSARELLVETARTFGARGVLLIEPGFLPEAGGMIDRPQGGYGTLQRTSTRFFPPGRYYNYVALKLTIVDIDAYVGLTSIRGEERGTEHKDKVIPVLSIPEGKVVPFPSEFEAEAKSEIVALTNKVIARVLEEWKRSKP